MPTRQPDAVPDGLRAAAGIAWRCVALALAVVAALYALSLLKLVVLPVLLALLLASVLQGPVDRLERRGIKRSLAATGVLFAAVFLLIGVFAFIGPSIASQSGDLGKGIEDGARTLATDQFGVAPAEVDRSIDEAVKSAKESRALRSGLLTGALVVGQIAAGLLLVLALLFYVLSDGRRIWRWMLELVPPAGRDDVDALGARTWHVLAGYMQGTAAVALVDAVLIAILLAVLGVPLVLPLAVLTFIAGFIPVVGATLAGLAAALVALAANGPAAALIVVAGIVVIQQVEGNVLQPVLVGGRVSLHPLVVILAVAVGGVLGGVIGAFVAVPMAAVAGAVLDHVRDKRGEDVPDAPQDTETGEEAAPDRGAVAAGETAQA